MPGLEGSRILITSGPTRGPLDAVRYISPKSTGRLGVMLAGEALSRGAAVTFVYGKGSLVPDADELGPERFSRLKLLEIETVPELLQVMTGELEGKRYDAVLHSMAVLDYVPEEYVEGKTPSGQSEWWIKLIPTPKVVKLIKELQPQTVLVSFKLEVNKSSEELIGIAYKSLLANSADLVLANDLYEIEHGRHVGYIVNPEGEVEALAEGKEEIARTLLDAVAERVKLLESRRSIAGEVVDVAKGENGGAGRHGEHRRLQGADPGPEAAEQRRRGNSGHDRSRK